MCRASLTMSNLPLIIRILKTKPHIAVLMMSSGVHHQNQTPQARASSELSQAPLEASHLKHPRACGRALEALALEACHVSSARPVHQARASGDAPQAHIQVARLRRRA